MLMTTPRPNAVIVGGGFGGLNAALGLRHVAVDVTLVDRRNYHLFQPLLYQVATGGLSPANIAAPLRAVLKRQANTEVILGEVVDLDVIGRRVILADGEVPFDTLVLATGATHFYFGHPEWEKLAPGPKAIEDATEIRRRILRAFETAERCPDDSATKSFLTFVVVGAGATGVEMAGAISELARFTLRKDFRRIDPTKARIVLVEGTDRVLPSFRPTLSEKASRSLVRLGVEVWTGAFVTNIQPGLVTVRRGDKTETIAAQTVIWAAGVAASPLGEILATKAGAKTDRQGRVIVQPDLTIPGHPEIFVIGDLAAVNEAAASQRASVPAVEGGKPAPPPTLPGVAPVAIQEGRYVASSIRKRLAGQSVPPFIYRDKGSMATIGRASAVADLGWIAFSGYLAWLAWLFIHLLYLVQFQSRVLVLFQWAWSYVTRNRSARLITNEIARPLVVVPRKET
jgi:NADH:ubiquinone reductase (H+-translocating)